MRASAHDHSIREFTITGTGMQIGEPLLNTTGILTGNVTFAPSLQATSDNPGFGGQERR